MFCHSFSVLCSLICFSVSLSAQPSGQDREVRQPIVKLFDALSDRNAAAVRSECTDDVRFYEYGNAWPVDTLIDLAITKNTAADFKRINTFEFLNTTIAGNAAWVTYNLQSDITRNGKNSSIHWQETVILVHGQNGWKIRVLHSTRVDKK